MPLARIGSLSVVALLAVTACADLQPLEDPPERPDISVTSLDGHEVQDGGELAMGLSEEPDALDPTTSSSLYTRYVMETVCQKLYDIDADGEVVPQLATELPDISEDELTATIPLREDATFADGADFDADAVVTTLERHLEHDNSARADELGPITDIEAIDDYTVEVEFDEPFAPFTAALADRAGMIMSPDALDELGDDFAENPTCVGPFKFEDRVPQTSIDVVADPEYYDAENVHLDAISYQIMTDANIRAANIRSGDVQVIDTVSPQDIDALETEDDVEILQVGSLGYQGITINLGNTDGVGEPPGEIDTDLAQDPQVRLALSKAIDREALVNTVFNGWYEPACSPIPPESNYATEASNECPTYDPDVAQELLENAGVETPVTINVQVTNDPDQLRYAQALQASVEPTGFELDIEPVEYTALLDTQTRGDFEALLLGWSGRIDPHGNMYNFHQTGASNNYPGMSDETMDDLLTDAAQVNETSERAEIYGDAVTRLHEMNPVIYTYRLRNLVAQSDEVAGIEVYPDGVVRLSNAAFIDPEAAQDSEEGNDGAPPLGSAPAEGIKQSASSRSEGGRL